MSPQIKSVDLQYPRQVSELLCSPRRAERGPRSRTCNCPFPLTFLRLGISHGHRVTEGISQHVWGRLGPSQPAPGGLQPCFGQQDSEGALPRTLDGHYSVLEFRNCNRCPPDVSVCQMGFERQWRGRPCRAAQETGGGLRCARADCGSPGCPTPPGSQPLCSPAATTGGRDAHGLLPGREPFTSPRSGLVRT